MEFSLLVVAVLVAGALMLLVHSLDFVNTRPMQRSLVADPMIQSLVIDLIPACILLVSALVLAIAPEAISLPSLWFVLVLQAALLAIKAKRLGWTTIRGLATASAALASGVLAALLQSVDCIL